MHSARSAYRFLCPLSLTFLRSAAGVLALVSLIIMGGCRQVPTWIASIKAVVCDPAPPQPVDVRALLDTSPGSPASVASFTATLDVVLPFIASRPDSRLAVFVMGDRAEETLLVASCQVGRPTKHTLRARRDYEARFIDEARSRLVRTVAPYFASAPRHSPIIASIAKVQLASAPATHRRVLIVESDLREESRQYGLWECGHVPAEDQLVHRVGDLFGQTLANTTVYLTGADLRPVANGRCEQSIQRRNHIVADFRAVLSRAGAHVYVTPGTLTSLEGEP